LGHNWSEVVREVGLGSSGCTLAARYLIGGNLIVTNERLTYDDIRIWSIPLDPDLPYVKISLDAGLLWHLPFPYGQLVEPDFPV